MTETSQTTDQLLDEVARLLALLVRLKVGNQAQAIQELSRAGIRQSRIAVLLGTSPGTVKVTVTRARRSGK